ncbi:MAG TPA: isovaleryl-CoA dehydrogenase [Oxalobacteraceae bacterium]|nr:isovaleryl-CoA dehydrogenase [Oxalobacteraceae bacterium]
MQWFTHEVTNQVPELRDYDLFASDLALCEGVERENADWHLDELRRLGTELGQGRILQLGDMANRYPPELMTYDRCGYRTDVVSFHPSWHLLLALLRREGLHALPWMSPCSGAHVARAAGYYLHAQIEAGTLCPTTMTFAAIPVLQKEPLLFAQLQEKLYSLEHDPRDLPIEAKDSILIGMGMTEKQGGSDVRSNATMARADGPGGRGGDYLITGHKWFFSAPMCDAHLVLARCEEGFSCFFVPRWRPDGSKNAVLVQRLKDKLGNRSNSSCEVEFQEACGILVGEEGRGIPTILEMAAYTRLDCVIGSAGLMRQAFAQAAHHARYRSVFGKPLIEQPLMRNVLCDLALESEAATLLMLRLAAAFDYPDDPLERAWRRIMTPAAKFWICKRALEFCGECMEVWGGNGYVETGPMARLYREAPVNSIWEGSGNVMCLDVLRAIEREPESMELLLEELESAVDADADADVRALIGEVKDLLATPPQQREMLARRLAQNLALAAQSCLMLQHAPSVCAEAFIASRNDPGGGRVYGTLSGTLGTSQSGHLASIAAQRKILTRAWPI